MLADINGTAARAGADEIIRQGGRGRGIEVDVGEPEAVHGMIEDAITHYGRLDILYNNAAAISDAAIDDDLVTTDIGVWQRSFAVNTIGMMVACKYAIPHMIEQGGGVIISTSSGSAVIGEPTRFAYGASKAAINALTRSIAARYGKQGIRCVAVSPGITMTEQALQYLEGTGWLDMMRRHHATPYLANPADIARFVVFLASDDARFITGSFHPIDGGSSTAAPYGAEMREHGYGVF